METIDENVHRILMAKAKFLPMRTTQKMVDYISMMMKTSLLQNGSSVSVYISMRESRKIIGSNYTYFFYK